MNSDDHLYVNVMAFGHLVGAAFVVLLIVLFANAPWLGGTLSMLLITYIFLQHRKRLNLEQHRRGLMFQGIFLAAFSSLWLYFMMRPEFILALAIVPILCSAYEYALVRSAGKES